MSVLLCTAGYDHSIRFWVAPTGQCIDKIDFKDSQVNRLALTDDRAHLAAAGNPVIRLYDTHTKSGVRKFDGHSGNVTGLGFLRNANWMYTCSEDGTVKVWDVRAPAPTKSYKQPTSFTTADLHPNQAEIIVGDQDGHVYSWDLAAEQFSLITDTEGKVAIRDLSVAKDGSILTAANSRGTLLVWETSAEDLWSPVMRIDAHETYCLRCVICPNKRFIATTSADRTVKLWDIADNYSLANTLDGHQRWVWDCAFSADSAYLVSASSDKTGRLWELGTGETVMEYRGHAKACTAIVLNDKPL